MNPGIVGALTGCALGVAGGLFGTWFGVQKTNGPKERAFMIRASVILWAALTVFLALMFALPSPYRHLLWVPYAICLPLGIIKWNRTQALIREIESPSEATEEA